MPPTPSTPTPSVKGARTRLMSFRRALRLGKARYTQGGTLNKPPRRDPNDVPNPHFGYRRSTAAHATAVARSQAELVPLVDSALDMFFTAGQLTAERLRLYLDEHREAENLDGTNILVLSYVGQFWPQLPTLELVRRELYKTLDLSVDFPPLSEARRAELILREQDFDRWRGESIRMLFDKETEAALGASLASAAALVGLDCASLSALASRWHGRRGEAKKDFTMDEEVEFLGFMSLLSSYDYSVLREQSRPRAGSPSFIDWPRRMHSRHRLMHLMSKVYDGSLALSDGAVPRWETDPRKMNGPLALTVGRNRRLVSQWISSATQEILGTGIDLQDQLKLVLDISDVSTSIRVADELIIAAAATGHRLARRSVVRKARSYAELAAIISAREETGYFWTLAEEEAIAAHLVENKGQPLDLRQLADLVPTRSMDAIRRRLGGKRAGAIKSLILQIEAEAASMEDSDIEALGQGELQEDFNSAPEDNSEPEDDG